MIPVEVDIDTGGEGRLTVLETLFDFYRSNVFPTVVASGPLRPL